MNRTICFIGALWLAMFIVLMSCATRSTSDENSSPVIILSRTATSESTAQVTSAFILQSTPTRAVFPTSTVVQIGSSTFETQQAIERAIESLYASGGCTLPCWWSIDPGRTSWQEAQAILAPVASRIQPIAQANSSQTAYDVMIPVPEDIYPTRLEHRYVVEKDVVQKIEVVVGNVDIYRLPEFLKNFGQPREIWVATYSRSREGSLPFTVVLYYPDQGILARFGSEAKVEGDLIVGCPQEYPALNLVLWSPDRKYLSFEEAVNDTLRLSPFEQWGYQRLEEISNLDTGSFNEVYKAASNLECIHTEASYWPSP